MRLDRRHKSLCEGGRPSNCSTTKSHALAKAGRNDLNLGVPPGGVSLRTDELQWLQLIRSLITPRPNWRFSLAHFP